MMAIRRLQRHGSGKEIRVPVPVCRELGLVKGDYVAFTFEPGDGSVKISKVQFGERKNGKEQQAQAVITAEVSAR